MKRTRLKGGSLSETCLIENDDGTSFVRKSVSLVENRVYGYQRWYSQLKRIQRYSVMFPGIFPKLIRFGMIDEDAYFDIEYYEQGVNAHDYLENCDNSKEVDTFFDILLNTISQLHKTKIPSSQDAIELYLYEEVEQKIKDCHKNKSFVDFIKNSKIIFNGKKVNSFMTIIEDFKYLSKKYYVNPEETFTHGNITLENLLYIPNEKKFIFIDPYEENIIDSCLAEYSQLLQSSNAKYEIYNRQEQYILSGNRIELHVDKNKSIDYFNDKLLSYLKSYFNKEDYIMIRLLEISQFIRMLPFKMEVDEKKNDFLLWFSIKIV